MSMTSLGRLQDGVCESGTDSMLCGFGMEAVVESTEIVVVASAERGEERATMQISLRLDGDATSDGRTGGAASKDCNRSLITMEAEAMIASVGAMVATGLAGDFRGQVALAWCTDRQLKQCRAKPM